MIETIEEMREYAMGLRIQAGEMQAEHMSETAMFGDSGPGTQIRIRQVQEALRDLEAEIEAREAAFVGPIPMTKYEAEQHLAYQRMINFVGPGLPVPF